MGYAELIKSIRICDRVGGCEGCIFVDEPENCNCYNLLMKAAADAIEALQRACANYAEQACENQTKWVSVEERLPSAGQVLINLHYMDGFNEVSLGEHWNCPDIPEEDGWGGFGGDGVVTHWMPLPEPPKGETE